MYLHFLLISYSGCLRTRVSVCDCVYECGSIFYYGAPYAVQVYWCVTDDHTPHATQTLVAQINSVLLCACGNCCDIGVRKKNSECASFSFAARFLFRKSSFLLFRMNSKWAANIYPENSDEWLKFGRQPICCVPEEFSVHKSEQSLSSSWTKKQKKKNRNFSEHWILVVIVAIRMLAKFYKSQKINFRYFLSMRQ